MAKKDNSALIEEGQNKEEAIYIRIDTKTLSKIEKIQTKHKHRTRSHTIRALISWAFDNGVDLA
jgi:outer membrane protein assembly factor BamA